MKPMCGPAFGLVIALRALLGRADVREHQLDRARRELLGQSVLPISLILRRGVLERRARREAHVDALHRLVDLGEERARQARRPPRRWRRPARAHAAEDRRRGSASDRAQRAGVAVGDAVDGALDSASRDAARARRVARGR